MRSIRSIKTSVQIMIFDSQFGKVLSSVRHVAASDQAADSIRVLVALATVIIGATLADLPHALIPLTLGVIASGIAETDDGPRDRIRALLVTLGCFAVAAVTVVALADHPALFAPALLVGTFALVMLGAVSGRYATISNATLLLSIYTMIAVEQSTSGDAPLWQQPLWLLAGAAAYGVIAALWNGVFVRWPVRQALARLFVALGDYLDLKSRLFEPTADIDRRAINLQLAEKNARVVNALNDTRGALLDRLKGRWSRTAMDANLRIYMAAQDIHERSVSIHRDYDQLSEAYFHSDVMFRLARLVARLGQACRIRADNLRFGGAYTDRAGVTIAVEELGAAMDRNRESSPDNPLATVVDELSANLSALADRVARADQAESVDAQRTPLRNPAPANLFEFGRRIRVHITPSSARFRHGLRLALAMTAGYGVLQFFHPSQGFWILLTTLLVCQPDTGATRRRFVQRIVGTAAGLIVGWALLQLYPAPAVQLTLTVIAGVIFFAARFRRYTLAAGAISVLVLLSFNQVGNGFDLIAPRLLDTLIGSALAVLAMLLVLPDWRERDLHRRLADALYADSRYLTAIFAQYLHGKDDDLAYRIARRDAHNADASVSTHVTSAQRDLRGHRSDSREAFALLASTQTLLGHLSTLGAHRMQMSELSDNAVLRDAADYLSYSLKECGDALIRGDPMPVDSDREADLRARLESYDAPANPAVHTIAGQLLAVIVQLPGLRRLGQALVRDTG